MSIINNIPNGAQASQLLQGVAAPKAANVTDSSLSSVYESLNISANVTIDLSGASTLLDTYKTDTEKVNAMKADLDGNIGTLKQMIMKLLDTQGNISNVATDNLHKLVNKITESGGVDELAKQEAQALVSEDGYWGVTHTSQRILDFATALGGGNPAKMELLRDAFIDGFKQAEKLFGGELPEISHKTYEKVISGFDAWTKGGETVPVAAE